MSKISQIRFSLFAFIFVLLTSLVFLFAPAGRTSYQPSTPADGVGGAISSESAAALLAEYHRVTPTKDKPVREAPTTDQFGIREEVPQKYMGRYQHWKREFLATETGRQQWAFYQNNPNFTLIMVVSRDNPGGGTTSNYKWNKDGELVAATITLGCRLDTGVPNPVYFPVMNSLLPTETSQRIDGKVLAAAKIAHEFGHVLRTAKGDPALYQLQVQLVPQYNQIFLRNGRDASDPRLIDLARKMGATPVEIWEDREYWGETNAMLYLRDRFAEDGFRCLLFGRIKRSVELYAPSYEERFLHIAQSTPSSRQCGW